MKPFVCLLILIILAVPAFSESTALTRGSADNDAQNLNQQYDKIRNHIESFKSGEATKVGALMAHGPVQPEVYSPGEGLPKLNRRQAKEPNTYTQNKLISDLLWTQENIFILIEFIYPPQKDWRVAAPITPAKQVATARTLLTAESSAAAELIAATDVELARGVPRDPPSAGLRPISIYTTEWTPKWDDPTPQQRLETLAVARANVLGNLGSLIELRKRNPRDTDAEKANENYMKRARETLAKALKDLGESR